MTIPIIITCCVLILIAYIFDVIAFRVRTPSVVLLLALGLICQGVVKLLNLDIPDLSVMLPVFGTIGLILIVLEGALELDIDQSKIAIIKKAFLVAVIPMVIISMGIAFALYAAGNGSFKVCLSNAIPLSVISSAVAIPSVKSLAPDKKEFVIYESSISDIAGVVIFNFVAMNRTINFDSVTKFGGELLMTLFITILATIAISLLINRLQHNVKYTPILIVIVLVYAIAKLIHLPALIFVLLCGLFLGNILHIKNNKWVKKLHPMVLSRNVSHFKEIAIEATFLVRILFFILFGYLIDFRNIINLDTLPWAAGIVAGVLIVRTIFLKFTGISLSPLMFIAPRGLITILLFYNILPEEKIPLVNTSLIIQVVLITSLLMMAGLILSKEKDLTTASTVVDPTVSSA